ncbi:hypothetical protein Tco_0678811 [Tanacetum coccineum]|uniref:Uncharacterized protein n=1 Tax=Tanacetum coccineum TaxID=301880 RepID=A0ABQ4XG57_9ASTR
MQNGEDHDGDDVNIDGPYYKRKRMMVITVEKKRKESQTRKDGVIRVLPPVSAAEIHAVEKERKTITILLMAIPKEHLRRFHGNG